MRFIQRVVFTKEYNMKLRSAGFFAITLITITATLALASGNWSNTGSMNVARYEHTATILANGWVLVTGGANDTAILSSAELYNPSTGKWTFTGSMTVPRYGHDAVLLQDGRVLVAGGFPPACCGAPGLASAELYNPATGTWTATGNMTAGRVDFTLTPLSNGKVLAAGGDNVTNTSAELYDRGYRNLDRDWKYDYGQQQSGRRTASERPGIRDS
jgi:hypothetical protein